MSEAEESTRLGRSWADHHMAQLERSERRAWYACGGFALVAALGVGNSAFQASRPIPPPVPIVVDRTTGETFVSAGLNSVEDVPRLSVVDEHGAQGYVLACEAYYYGLLGTDYKQCARMSTPDVFAPYAARFTGDNAMQTKVGETQEHRITIIDVRLSTSTVVGRNGEAIVTFDKEIRSRQGLPPSVTRYVATMRYEYRPLSMKKKVDQLNNPLGFVVLSYRTNEVLVRTPPAADAAVAKSP